MKYILLSVCAVICMSASCNKASDGGKTAPTDCDKVMCTAIFKMLNITITDKAGSPVKLDDYYTIRKSTGEKIKGTETMNNGNYTVLDDGYRKNIVNTKEEFTFIGMLNGKEVVNEPFTITADCCHVEKISGKNEVALP